MRNIVPFLIITLIIIGCRGEREEELGKMETTKIQLESPAFKDGENIPVKYKCDGKNISPEIFWKDTPEDVKSFALICDDPDAPMKTWVHWVIFNIPSDMNKLKRGNKTSGYS